MRNAVPLVVLVTFVLALPALGIALVKPSVVGTTARASKENVRSIGYSIYYTLVNIGGAAGPLSRPTCTSNERRERLPRRRAQRFPDVHRACCFSSASRAKHDEVETASLAQAGRNFLTVLSNPRFMLFLAIFTGYWIVYWQIFITLPLYVHDYINASADTELLLATGPLVVICLTVAINLLTQKMPALTRSFWARWSRRWRWIMLILHADGGRRGADAGCRSRSARSRSRRGITNTSRAWRHRDSRGPTWASRFCRWASARWSPGPSADTCCTTSAKRSISRR